MGASPAAYRPLFLFSMLMLAVVASLLLFFFEPGSYNFYPRCLFHQTTGLLCPGCGSLRAFHQLLHGHLAAALHLNVLFVFSLIPASLFAARSFLFALKRETRPLDFHPAWFGAALFIGLLFGVLRNLPFAHAASLAP